jgi:hypothetical protein
MKGEDGKQRQSRGRARRAEEARYQADEIHDANNYRPTRMGALYALRFVHFTPLFAIHPSNQPFYSRDIVSTAKIPSYYLPALSLTFSFAEVDQSIERTVIQARSQIPSPVLHLNAFTTG